tara:strand:+ start:577 stop:792 length:216 start_codon:yes stop_codon:yes gene_type:complete
MMEELVNMIATDASAADVSDQIKDLLYAKSAKKIDDLRPTAAGNLFGTETQPEVEVETEVETQPEEEEANV